MVPTLSYTIWFSQRTGSSLLTTALEATGIAGHPHEWMETPEGKGLLDHYKAADGAALAARLRKCGSTDNGVFGAKVSYREPRMTEAFDLLREVPGCPADASRPEVWAHTFPNHHHIFMTRRNRVRLAASWWRAIRSQQWHLRSDGSDGQTGRIPDIDADYSRDAITQLLAESVMREAGIEAFLSEAGIVPLTLVYEDFVQDYEDTVRRVLAWLDLAPTTGIPAPALRRTADDVTEAWVQRYREERQAGWTHRGW